MFFVVSFRFTNASKTERIFAEKREKKCKIFAEHFADKKIYHEKNMIILSIYLIDIPYFIL